MKSYLHSNLHHGTAEDKCRICDCSFCGDWPCAQQTQGFYDVVVGLIPDGVPYQVGQRFREVLQQSWSTAIPARCHTYDGPEEQFVVLRQVFVRRAHLIQKG